MKKIVKLVSALAISTIASAQITLPYVEDFEGVGVDTLNATTSPVAGIPELSYENGGVSGRAVFNSGVVGAGTKSLMLESNTNAVYDTNYATLTLDMTNYNAASDFIYLSFYCHDEGDETHSADKVWVRGSNVDPWLEIYDWEVNVPDNSGMLVTGLDVSSLLNSNSQNYSTTFEIRFGQYDNYTFGSDGVAFDEVMLELVTCPQPDSLMASNLTDVSADLSWIEIGSALTWQIEYGPTGFTPGTGSTVVTAANPHNLGGLTPNTTYDFYVRAICGVADTSAWSSMQSFTTECAVFTLPWSEGFENAGTIPDCWTMGGGENWLFNVTGPNHVGNGGTLTGSTVTNNYYAVVDASGAHAPAFLMSPYVDISSLAIPALSFYEISDNEGFANSVLEVEVWDGAAWNFIDSLFTNTAGWEQKIYDLSGLTFTGPAAVRFTFSEQVSGDFYDDIAIDDVTFEERPSCIDPSNLMSANVTAGSADLYWTENGSALSWMVEYGPSGFTPGTGTSVLSSVDSLALTGLASATSYDFYVMAICGVGDSSAWIGPSSFTTLCTPFVATYTQNFDGAPASDPFAGITCWTIAGPGANDVELSSTTDDGEPIPSLPNAVELNDGNLGIGDSAILVSPAFSDLGTGLNQIRFMAHQESGGAGNLYIGVMSDPTDASSVVIYDSVTSAQLNAAAGFQEYTILMNNLALIGSNQHIAFIHGSNAFELYVDDFVYEPAPACPAPSGLTVVSVTDSSATITWTDFGAGTQWQIEYDTAGYTPGTGMTMTANNDTITIVGLNSTTDYDFYVSAICAGTDTSSWAGPATGTTDCGIYTPYYLEDFTTFVPTCWEEADNGDMTTGPTNPGASSWTNGTAIGNTVRVNLYTSTRSEWMLSPFFDLSGGSYDLSIDVAVTDWLGSTPDMMGSDDSVRVVYSEDGVTWNMLMLWTAADSLPDSLVNYTLPIPSSGTSVQFGVLATDGPVNDIEDYDFHFDNFEILVNCATPSAPTMVDAAGTSVTIGWTENGSATNWDIEYGPTGFTLGTGTVVNATTNPFTVTGLTDSTDYDFYVMANCSSTDTSPFSGGSTINSGTSVDTTGNTAVASQLIESVNVFPNPAKGVVNIEFTDFDNHSVVELISTRGEIVSSMNIRAQVTSIDVSELSAGMYTVRVVSEKGIGIQKLTIK